MTSAASFGSLPQALKLFKLALDTLVKVTPAQRAVVLYGEADDQEFQARVARGLELESFWVQGALSMTMLREVRATGAPLLMNDAQAEGEDRLSLLLSQIRSVLCIPFWGPGGRICGILYADTLAERATFSREHLDKGVRLARELEEALNGVREGKAPVKSFDLAARWHKTPSAPRRAASRPTVAPSRRWTAPAPRARAVFWRSLSTLLGAGISLPQGLDVLAVQAESKAQREVADELSGRLHNGQTLSAAMEALDIFESLEIRMVAVGERSGGLHRALECIAAQDESRLRIRYQLRSALLYPAFVLTMCLVLLVVGPSYLMAGQFQLLRQLGVPFPALTRLLAGLSGPFVLPLLGLALVAALAALRRTWGHPGWRRVMLRIPLLSRVLRHSALSQFARTLAITLGSGMMLTEALPTAGGVTDLPLLEEETRTAMDLVLEGTGLAQALGRETRVFPRAFLEMVQVGEESGQLPGILSWLADFYEQELSLALATLVSLLEPTVMLLMGIVATVVMLATLLPMVQAVQAL